MHFWGMRQGIKFTNIVDIKGAVEEVLEEFDHHHLNLDLTYFEDRIPTTENLVVTLWDLVGTRLPKEATLTGLRLSEDEDLYVEYYGGG